MKDSEQILNEILDTEKSALIDVLESGSDLFISNEFIKSFPVLEHICNALGIVRSIRDVIFIKKLTIFISNLPNASEKDKEYFMKRYLKDEKKFVEKLIEIIDNLDDSKKAEYESKIFEKYFYQKITYDEFLKYSYSLTKINVSDIIEGYNVIKNKKDKDENGNIMIPGDFGGAYVNVGMSEIVTMFGTCGFSLNDSGINFLKCIFE